MELIFFFSNLKDIFLCTLESQPKIIDSKAKNVNRSFHKNDIFCDQLNNCSLNHSKSIMGFFESQITSDPRYRIIIWNIRVKINRNSNTVETKYFQLKIIKYNKILLINCIKIMIFFYPIICLICFFHYYTSSIGTFHKLYSFWTV